MCVLTTLGSAFAEDPDTEYLGPEGEDDWGTTYTVQEVPQQLWEVLDDNGEYVIPSFINNTVWRGKTECWVIDQNPAPGAVVSCPQTVVVELTCTCDGGIQFQGELPIELIDFTPPEISITLAESHTPHLTFGNVMRYPASAEVLPLITISISDACGVESQEVVLNGQPYQYGTPITGVGLHTLHVKGVDFSDNWSTESVIFEIRERPSYIADIEIESGGCVVNDDSEIELVGMTLRISSPDFEPEDVRLSSIRLLALDWDGRPLNSRPLSIKDALLPESTVLDHENVAASIGDTHVRAYFEFDFRPEPLPDCPASFIVFGVGHDGEEIAFEFGASFFDSEGVLTLMPMAGELGWEPGGGDGPGTEPPAGCAFVQTPIVPPVIDCEDKGPIFVGSILDTVASKNTKISAGPTYVTGNGNVQISTRNTTGYAASTMCHASNIYTLLLNMVGDGCCTCSISVNADATVHTNARVSGANEAFWTASASASAQVGLIAGCGLPVNAAPSSTASKTNPNVTSGPIEDPSSASASISCVANSCSTYLYVVSFGSFIGEVWARAAQIGFNPPVLVSGRSRASGSISTTGILIESSATYQECDCLDNVEDGIECPELQL